jgi:zinc transporter ZupT
MEKFYVWAIFRIGRAYCSCFRGFCSYIFTPILPYALAFAAGAMIFVVVEEVIPETQQDNNGYRHDGICWDLLL